jgi:nitroreductase
MAAMNHALTDAIAQRVSANFFDPARGVDDDIIRTLVSWATRAPTAFNLQNWRFIAVRSQEGKRRLRELAWNQAMVPSWEAAASRLYADSPQTQRDEAVRSATFGASTLMLAGQAQGLAASPMTGFDAAGVAQAFGLRQEEVPVMLVAMGYAQEGNWPQKPRRPVHDVLELA